MIYSTHRQAVEWQGVKNQVETFLSTGLLAQWVDDY